MLEIGPGDGRLTQQLLTAGAVQIHAIELDSRFAEMLRTRFVGAQKPVTVIEADVLKVELPKTDVVVGNIPYYISSDIIFRLATGQAKRIVLMVQKEFAEKMVAKAGDSNYGRLSVTSQLAFTISLERIVPKHLFKPAPKVDSAIIVLTPTGKTLSEFDADIIRILFQHKNRTVRNALVASKRFDAESVAKLGDLLTVRPRTLTKEKCLEIAKLLKDKKE